LFHPNSRVLTLFWAFSELTRVDRYAIQCQAGCRASVMTK
jgi:hypothetical protein